ncbi:hypothetical protein PCASD_11293 [Puccinia coronata f. sp. avenae]|uniref:Uncharacterized protein n=1 Tax=Puccinia coronata f. sp. avenae TaxID=200324 RepID=A0A2N5UIZ1_9BASI|nr:hypothetical protein PCASD_26140 [Puccinia coronata f. sp. avenae]PLW37720.1 hypothetical protein PCASD_11293 [Puccinia coronata f. sp. avenae]
MPGPLLSQAAQNSYAAPHNCHQLTQNIERERDEQQGALLASTQSGSKQTCPTTCRVQPPEPSRQYSNNVVS